MSSRPGSTLLASTAVHLIASAATAATPHIPALETTTHPKDLQTAHSLALLQEYAHTLDTLPLDLSRHFADLRELDAVLSASMHAVTTKILKLTALVENKNNASRPDERLWLLAEIADEASKLKPGGEDKIRVACQAADTLRAHRSHLSALLENVPEGTFDNALRARSTTYPHVNPTAYTAPGVPYDSGRRRRAALGTGQPNPSGYAGGGQDRERGGDRDRDSPIKRKRAPRDADDDDDRAYPTPRRDRATEGTASARPPRTNTRVKKNERAASPPESAISASSHLRPTQTARTGSGVGQSRSRPARSAAIDALNQQEALVGANGHVNGSTGMPSRQAHILDGPGVSAAAAARQTSVGEPMTLDDLAGDLLPDDSGELGEVDGTLYCICQKVSEGQMVGCDNKSCPYEWFHYECVGITDDTAPAESESWTCPWCTEKAARKTPRSRRGAQKRGGGGSRKKNPNRSVQEG